MLLMVEKGITGRIWHTTYRYVKSNNKYAKNYDKKKNYHILSITQPANIGSQDVSRTSPTNVPRALPRDHI